MENSQVITASKNNQEIFDQIISWLIPFLIFLTPLFFLPLTPNFYGFNKMYFLLAGSFIIFALLLVKGLLVTKITFYATSFDLAVFLFFLAFVASSIFASPNRVLPFLGKTGIILSLTCFYFALTQSHGQPHGSPLRRWLQALITSSFVLSWISIFAFVQLWPKILPWDFLKSQAFTPAGSLTALVAFQVTILAVSLVFALKSNQFLNKILYFLAAALATISTVLVLSLMLPGKPASPALLSPTIGWWIAVEIFKSAKTAFLGVGPEGFLTAFSRFRPASFNNLKLWNLRFTSSSNEFFQILTTTGLFGFISLLYLLLIGSKKIYKDIKRNGFNMALKVGFALAILSLLLIPASFLTLFTLYLLIAIIAKQTADKKTLTVNQPIKLGFGLAIACLFVFSYFSLRAWRAEAVFKKSLAAAAANKGLETYNRQIEAIRLNPFQEKYRVSYSNVNFGLANSLAAKKDLSDQDRQNITQLISQAINEAKAATALNPQNPIYWENLAGLYRNLINFANGADQWATGAYVQAIRLDPLNPNLRLDLGGLLYSLGNYETAIDQFKRAIDLKPDLANAYYNLAWAYNKKGENKQAFLNMQRVISLIPQDTEDFVKASQELEQLRELLPEEEKLATAAAQKKEPVLTPPQPLPSTPPAGPINLPEESGPQVPSPEPSSSPEEEIIPSSPQPSPSP